MTEQEQSHDPWCRSSSALQLGEYLCRTERGKYLNVEVSPNSKVARHPDPTHSKLGPFRATPSKHPPRLELPKQEDFSMFHH